MNCTARTQSGRPCKANAINGGNVCNKHGGSAPQTRALATIRHEVSKWQLGEAHDDPIETLLRLITQSRWRAEHYATLLGQAYEAAERIGEADNLGDLALSADAKRDLDEVLHHGGVAALIGKTYSATEGHIYAASEAIRGLVALERDERDRLAKFCKLAIDAGIAERMVRVAERQVEIVGDALKEAIAEAGLTPEVARQVVAGVARRLRLVG